MVLVLAPWVPVGAGRTQIRMQCASERSIQFVRLLHDHTAHLFDQAR
jgi:hypothetical protein